MRFREFFPGLFTLATIGHAQRGASCPEGYEELDGDTPEWGQVGGRIKAGTASECSTKCDANPSCCSFEWSPSELLCNLNTDCQPSQAAHLDFLFCSKGSCKCGLAKRLTRIVGGQETEVHEYPWQVGMVLYNRDSVWCGASLISNQWILTAAHCVTGDSPGDIQVLLGEHDYSSTSESTMDSVRADIDEIMVHPQYNTGAKFSYDFALLKMKNAIDFDAHPHIRPICLPEDNSQDYSGLTATVTGWGTLSYGGYLSPTLQEVDVNVLSNSQCKNDYTYPSSGITDQMLCASVPAGGKDACQGDSGGPLVTSGSGDGVTAGQNYDLIGVVSWGYGCASANAPGVYSRVTAQLPWITANASPSGNSCPRT